MAEVLWDANHPGVYIDDRFGASFKHNTIQALNKIASRPVGADLLKILSKRHLGIGTAVGKKVVIALGQGTLAVKSVRHTHQSSTGGGTEVRKAPIVGTAMRLPGSGQGSAVQYNPNVEHQYTAAARVKTPVFVALAHELIHALHSISGDVVKAYSWTNGVGGSSCGAILEEARTVGLGISARTRISENAIRREHGLPQRRFYSTPGDCDNLVR
ncbi:MAG: M91 family zinc metallopeptidase [Gemmatimonadota bacterium]